MTGPEHYREAERLLEQADVDAILAEAAANPLTTWSEPFHGDLIPDVDYLSGVECDMRADRAHAEWLRGA